MRKDPVENKERVPAETKSRVRVVALRSFDGHKPSDVFEMEKGRALDEAISEMKVRLEDEHDLGS